MQGSSSIDSIVVSKRLMEFAEDSKLILYNKIVWPDYRAYIIDINLENYLNNVIITLDLAKRSYRLKFAEELEEQLDQYQIKSLIQNNLARTDQ